jgi:hypothetical protein
MDVVLRRKYMSKKSVASNVVILILMILAVTANTVAIPPVDFPVTVTVTNGKGIYNSPEVPIPCGEVKVTGYIESPENGNWTIRVWVNKRTLLGKQQILVFSQSGIAANEKIPEIPVSFKPLSMASVHAEVSWSEKADTTLVVRAKGSCK